MGFNKYVKKITNFQGNNDLIGTAVLPIVKLHLGDNPMTIKLQGTKNNSTLKLNIKAEGGLYTLLAEELEKLQNEFGK